MTIEEHQEIITQIASNLGDQVLITDLLGKLRNDYQGVITQGEQYKTANEELQSKYNVALEKNMELFLQVGSAPKPNEINPPSGEEPPKDGEEPKLKYEDLFNEEGELK